MGHLIGIGGEPNTGKSHSRVTLRHPQESFIIMTSLKATYLLDEKGNNASHFTMHFPGMTVDQSLAKMKYKNFGQLLAQMTAAGADVAKSGLVVSGNYFVVSDITHADMVLKFVSACLPHIKQVIFPDFTHFITERLTSFEFRNRNKRDEAFARYIDLAAEAFHAFFRSAKLTRYDLLQIIEFHVDYDEIARTYKLFIPGGRMLKEKFKPESYFDTFLYSYFIDETENDSLPFGERFKFITRRWKHYDARNIGGMFDPDKELMIANDLQLVIDRVRQNQGI